MEDQTWDSEIGDFKTARKVPQNSLESCKVCLFQIIGQPPASGLIFNDLIKVAMENATFWENMQTLEQSASKIEEN